jgi:hypothetical protein
MVKYVKRQKTNQGEDSGILECDDMGFRRFEMFGNHEESWSLKLKKARRETTYTAMERRVTENGGGGVLRLHRRKISEIAKVRLRVSSLITS